MWWTLNLQIYLTNIQPSLTTVRLDFQLLRAQQDTGKEFGLILKFQSNVILESLNPKNHYFLVFKGWMSLRCP